VSSLRRHLTYGNVVSTLALFLVLAGGSAFAAKSLRHLPRMQRPNSVNSSKVRDNSLIGADLDDGGGVTGADVVPGSLGVADLAPDAVGMGKLAPGAIDSNKVPDGSLTSGKLAAGSVQPGNLAPKAVDNTLIVPDTLTGADVADQSLTGADINSSQLSVRYAKKLGGNPPSAFLTSTIEEITSSNAAGTPQGDGTFARSLSCKEGDELISGGAAGLGTSSTLVESYPTGNAWTVRIDPHGTTDFFQIVTICAAQHFLD
jgi:hypothetical protein